MPALFPQLWAPDPELTDHSLNASGLLVIADDGCSVLRVLADSILCRQDGVVRVWAGSWSDDGGLEGAAVGGGVGDGFVCVIQVEFGDFELIQIK